MIDGNKLGLRTAVFGRELRLAPVKHISMHSAKGQTGRDAMTLRPCTASKVLFSGNETCFAEL